MLALLLALAAPSLSAEGPAEVSLVNADLSQGQAGWKPKRTRGVTCDVDLKTGDDAPGSLRVLSTEPDGNGSWTQCVDISERRGQLLRVSGQLRTRGATGRLVLGVRLEDAEEHLLNLHQAEQVATATGDWVRARVELGIPEGAATACVEGWMSGQGTGWIDDVSILAWTEAPGLDTAPLDDRGVVNLTALGRLWTTIDLFYPALDQAGVDWDATLPRAVLAVELAADDQALAQVLRQVVAPLGGHVVVGEPAVAPPGPMVAKLGSDALHVVPGGDLPDLTGISAVFLDLRGGVGLPDDLVEHLLAGAVGLPKVQRIRHTGYGQREGLFEREVLVESAGEGFFGASTPELQVYALTDLDTSPQVGRGLMALRISGQGKVVGAPVTAWPEAPHIVQLTDTLQARVPLAAFVEGGLLAPDVPCPGALALDVAQAHRKGQAAQWSSSQRPGLPILPDAPLLHWQRHARLADTLAAWGLLDTFYPYWDVVEVDWPQVLQQGLRQSAVAPEPDGYQRILGRMVSQAQDGEAWVSVPGIYPAYQGPSLALDLVEGTVVVGAVLGSARQAGAQVGMEVLTVDGRPTLELLEDAAAEEFAATDRSRRLRALDWLLARRIDETVTLELSHVLPPLPEVAEGEEAPEPPEREVLTVQLPVDRSLGSVSTRPSHEPHEDLGSGVHYFDLVELDEAAWEEGVGTWGVEATAVIFDARGPTALARRAALSVLPKKGRDLSRVVFQRVAPGPGEPVQIGQRKVKARKPKLKVPVTFLVDARTQGEAEAWIHLAQGWGARVVGEPTAGTVSTAAHSRLPAGGQLHFSAVRVEDPDEGPLHGVGVVPDVEAQRTVQALREERDQALEVAMSQLVQPQDDPGDDPSKDPEPPEEAPEATDDEDPPPQTPSEQPG